jgi:threonine aldolase
VYGEDPTVRRLEERVADMLGTEAALFVPTGTMANQIALRAQVRHGDEVIIGRGAHCWRHESGALAALAGAQTQVIGEDGMFTAADVRMGFKADDPYQSPTRVVAVENTHNMAGGTCWDRAQLADVIETAHQLGMTCHLDGARIWNAAVATGVTEQELAVGFDSVSVCLSKGLGAPAGSVVCGSRALIKACHRFRKMYGGGMRQSGMLAAAGLYALEHHRARLVEDHANAKIMAEALAGAPGIRVDLTKVQTNIVMIDFERGTARAVVELAREEGVMLGTAGAQRVRAVTHLDVDRDGVLRAAQVIAEIAAKL